jgi:inositol phosphorylceramide synthase catalytic subunit
VNTDHVEWKYRAAAVAVAGYAALLFLWGRLGVQHLSLVVLFGACLVPYIAPRRFLADWWPMILFWLNYDFMRVYSPALLSRVAVKQPLSWEAALFLSPEGVIWPFYFTHWLARHQGEFLAEFMKGFANIIYLSHIFAVPVLLLIIWARRNDHLFRRLLWSLTALHVLAIAIYLAYPAAPPWWIYENGFVQPSVERSAPVGLDKGSILAGLFHLSPNRFAAIPSVHGAYPVLLTLALAFHGVRSRYIVLAGIYGAAMWFACVFLNQHYIIDLVLGAALIPIALLPVARIRKREVVP